MNTKNINVEYLNRVVAGEAEDVWYHYGISSKSALTEQMREIKGIVLCGSGSRAAQFAEEWAVLSNCEIIRLTKEERFTFCYTGGLIFSSHGMGMPSASIALHELMKMVYFLKSGDMEAIKKVFWIRVGTSGGFGGLTEGSVVVTTEALEMDLRPYRLWHGNEQIFFDCRYPQATAEEIAGYGSEQEVNVVLGKTLCSHDFYLETMRLDGAIIFDDAESRENLMQYYHSQGVRNNEMESAVVAGMLNHWGFCDFATVCCIIIDRSKGDQVTSTPTELAAFVNNAERVVFAFLKGRLLR